MFNILPCLTLTNQSGDRQAYESHSTRKSKVTQTSEDASLIIYSCTIIYVVLNTINEAGDSYWLNPVAMTDVLELKLTTQYRVAEFYISAGLQVSLSV